jgi:hypothetical protein
MSKCYFEYAENVYSVFFGSRFILLRVLMNDYVSLGNEASMYLVYILNNHILYDEIDSGLLLQDSSSDLEDFGLSHTKLSSYLEYFLKEGIISVTNSANRRNSTKVHEDCTGMSNIGWVPGNSQVGLVYKDFFEAIFVLHKVQNIIRKKKLDGLLEFLKLEAGKVDMFCSPDINYSIKLAKTLDIARMFYLRDTFCLPFAATLCVMHYRNKFNCDFIMGVQNNPFHAHAWVEVEGKVICDSFELKSKLADILRIEPKNLGKNKICR